MLMTDAGPIDAAFIEVARSRRRSALARRLRRRAVLPPISVVLVGAAYAVRDGHHRVAVARARGALTIAATVDTVQPGLGSA